MPMYEHADADGADVSLFQMAEVPMKIYDDCTIPKSQSINCNNVIDHITFCDLFFAATISTSFAAAAAAAAAIPPHPLLHKKKVVL